MIRVGIVGATGYTGLELLKILLRHPNVKVTRLTSRDETNPTLGDVHPELRQRIDVRFSLLDIETFAKDVDCAFCCLPHAASAEIISKLLATGIKVVDFSADYRLNDVETFESWYNVTHPDPERIGSVPYGLPELFRDRIQSAKLVANPGCFPTSALLPLAPLLQNEMIEKSPIIIDSKTGISGAGRKANLKFHFPECNESISAYGIGAHRHMPEVDQILARFTGTSVESIFTPHIVSMDRGILSTIYVRGTNGNDAAQLQLALMKFYADEPFVRITDTVPSVKAVSHTNFCDISVSNSRDMVVIVSALDNLIKGASGAAVQNFNLMHGLPETTALF